jgi:hypothetical protein
MYVHFKSLSGEIISVSLSSIPYASEEDIWNSIISIIANEIGCNKSQVVIMEEIEEKEPPQLIVDKQYNFFIRDRNDNRFSVNITSYWGNLLDKDEEEEYGDIYNKFSIKIYDNLDVQNVQNIDIFEKKSYNDFYFSGEDILCVKDDPDRPEKITNIKIINNQEFFSMYSILCSLDLNVPWYDKFNIIERIMILYNQIVEDFIP